MFNLCAPAIIYLIFSITQILIDTFKGLYNTVFIKIIVFIPFILMTVIVSMLLYVFGLDAATGTLNYKCNDNTNCGNNITVDSLGNIVIYDPEYDATKKPVYYQSPNIIIPNPSSNDINKNVQQNNLIIVPTDSSSHAYQS